MTYATLKEVRDFSDGVRPLEDLSIAELYDDIRFRSRVDNYVPWKELRPSAQKLLEDVFKLGEIQWVEITLGQDLRESPIGPMEVTFIPTVPGWGSSGELTVVEGQDQ